MNDINEIRQKVVDAFIAAHQKEYSDLPVDLPNLFVVDVDNQIDPFVKVDMYMPDTELAYLGEPEIDVKGRIYITYYTPKGSGVGQMYSYTQMLIEELSFKTFDGILFGAVKNTPIWNQYLKNWEGTMNTIDYNLMYSRIVGN